MKRKRAASAKVKQRRAIEKAVKTAIVCAYRPEENDLTQTIEAAAASVGVGATVFAVEDKDRSGPGQNRHRGIEAATDAEVIIIIDAHMRFQGDVLQRLAAHVKQNGGLATALCHHNEQCSFTGKDGHYYAGARIVIKSRDGTEQKPLDAKWARDNKPGERPCVMGACYAFRSDWYFEAGQPLAVLQGWGCDEQVLSIAAWLTGHMPVVIDGHVAHRWRPSPPWDVSPQERAAVKASRAAMVHCLVSNATDRHELVAWGGLPEVPFSAVNERFRLAMLNAPRKWIDWRAQVCEPEELDGKQNLPPSSMTSTPRRLNTPNILVPRSGIRCPHCAFVDERPEVLHTYANGNKRHRCGRCGNPFMSFLHKAAAVG